MPLIIIVVLTLIGAVFFGGNLSQSGDQFLNTPKYQPISSVCLDDTTAKNGIESPDASILQTIKKIKKPDFKNDFITGQGWVYPECENKPNGCEQTGDADYVLVAANVKVDPAFPRGGSQHGPTYPSDRQLLRYNLTTTISSDADTQKQLKGRAFRTFCGDWCCDGSPGCELAPPDAPGPLPYLGSFHCDFLFYLQDTDEKGNKQIDENGNLLQPNAADPNLPANGGLFSIYFRKDAKIPPKIQCSAPTPAASRNNNFFDTQVHAQNNQSGFEWDGKEWLYRRDGDLKNYEVNPLVEPYNDPVTGSNIVTNPMRGVTGDWEVFKNLNYPSGDDILYLVVKGEYESATEPLLTPSPTPVIGAPITIAQPPVRGIHFKEFHVLGVVGPEDVRSLQLGTFKPPDAADWIKKWYEESKPAIYFYPPNDTVLSVKLNPAGYLTYSDPLYDPIIGWKNFIAHPDGSLTYDNKQYPYLFYEAELKEFPIDKTTGYVVAGTDLVSYFKQILPTLGLNEKETNDFIDYWMHRLSVAQPYYFIHFLSNEQIEAIEPIDISQTPDTEIRIRTYFKPLEYPISVKQQVLPKSPARRGFTLVEWGGILDK